MCASQTESCTRLLGEQAGADLLDWLLQGSLLGGWGARWPTRDLLWTALARLHVMQEMLKTFYLGPQQRNRIQQVQAWACRGSVSITKQAPQHCRLHIGRRGTKSSRGRRTHHWTLTHAAHQKFQGELPYGMASKSQSFAACQAWPWLCIRQMVTWRWWRHPQAEGCRSGPWSTCHFGRLQVVEMSQWCLGHDRCKQEWPAPTKCITIPPQVDRYTQCYIVQAHRYWTNSGGLFQTVLCFSCRCVLATLRRPRQDCKQQAGRTPPQYTG